MLQRRFQAAALTLGLQQPFLECCLDTGEFLAGPVSHLLQPFFLCCVFAAFALGLLVTAAVTWAARPLVLAPIAGVFGRVSER